MRYTKMSAALICAVMFALTGCGGGDSTTSVTPAPATQTAYLLGGIIENLPYTCGKQTGRTGRLGQFKYMAGDSCVFTVGKMTFPVAASKVQKGYLTPYDLVTTPAQAQTLIAILYSISYSRDDQGLIAAVDNNLDARIISVDLNAGDSAVTSALATFKGTVIPVTVDAAKTRLAKTVNTDNTLVSSLDAILAQGTAVFASHGLSTESGKVYTNSLLTETDRNNKVTLRFYDGSGNPIALPNGCNYQSLGPCPKQIDVGLKSVPRPLPDGTSYWPSLWVTDGQNPHNNYAVIGGGQDFQSLGGANVGGISLTVGRSTNTSVGTLFTNAAFYAGSTPSSSPMSLMSHGAQPTAAENVAFPPSLNFGYAIDFTGIFTEVGTGTVRRYQCTNMMFSQGSTASSLKGVWTFMEDLVKMGVDAIEVYFEDGSNPDQVLDWLASFTQLTADSMDIFGENWWVFTRNAQVPSSRVLYKGNPAVLSTCDDLLGGGKVAMVVTSTFDDNTFDIYLAFPGQAIYNLNPVPMH